MSRACLAAMALSIALAPLARAQQLDEGARGLRVRARLCASPATGAPAQESEGTIAGHDSATLMLNGRAGLTPLPMARLQSLEANVRPARDFRSLGLLAGLLVGPVAAVKLAGPRTDYGGGEIAFIPIGGLLGMIGGWWLGSLASDDGVWRPLSLAPGQGSGC